jgi:D-alanine-D-alanine ligase
VVFNLAEGLEGRLFEEVRIAWVLESMGYRFTGNDAEALGRSTNKVRAKLMLAERGVPTPAWLAFQHPDQVDESVSGCLPFPVIVKPVAEDASQGIGPDAVVYNLKALRDRVAYVVECYRQVALAEAFVVGREFNVSLWGDPAKVLPLSEIDFSKFSDPYARIVSFSAKWEEGSFEYRNMPVLCPAPVDRELGTRITRTARQAWAAMGCRGYARVDMRVSPDGTPYVVEVNCNPDLSPDAGFYTASRTAGYSYEDMISHIMQLAVRGRIACDRTVARKHWAMQSRPARSSQRLPALQPQLWPAGLQPAAVPRGNASRARR